MGCADPRESAARRSRRHGRRPADSSGVCRRVLDGSSSRSPTTSSRRSSQATGYVTVAERTPTAAEFPGAPAENLVAGSVVFTPPPGPVPLDNHYRWWSYVKGANWRHPQGPAQQHRGPRQLSRRARRLRRRRGLRPLGRQAAARPRPSGNSRPAAGWPVSLTRGATSCSPGGKWMANIWQGRFPLNDTGDDGFAGIAPVGQFPPNGYGLYRHGRQRLGMVLRLVPPGCLLAKAPAGGVARQPPGAGEQPRPRRARPAQARASGRVVPLHRSSTARAT